MIRIHLMTALGYRSAGFVCGRWFRPGGCEKVSMEVVRITCVLGGRGVLQYGIENQKVIIIITTQL